MAGKPVSEEDGLCPYFEIPCIRKRCLSFYQNSYGNNDIIFEGCRQKVFDRRMIKKGDQESEEIHKDIQRWDTMEV